MLTRSSSGYLSQRLGNHIVVIGEMLTLVIVFTSVYTCTCAVSSAVLNHGHKKFSQRLRYRKAS